MNGEAVEALRQIAAGFSALADAIEGAPPEPEPEDEKPRAMPELRGEALRRRFRDWAVARDREPFGYDEACAELGLHVNTARKLTYWAVDRGIVERAGEERLARGRPRMLYRYRRVEAAKPKATAGGAAAKRAPVAGTGRQRKLGGVHRDVRHLVAELKAAGWMTDYRGVHIKVLDPKGRIVTTLPSTPSDHRSLPNARAKLRRAGAPV